MPIRDVAAMNRSLDNDYGTTRGPNAADSHELALFAGDPANGGLELDTTDCPGYARAVVLPADWNASVAGVKATNGLVQFADATAEWVTQATYFALIDGDDHTTMWDYMPLTEPVEVTAAGAGPGMPVRVFYADVFDAA